MSILRKTGLRRGLTVALVCITLLGSAYATWPRWSVALARAALAPVGIDIEELVMRIGTQQLAIERFSLSKRTDAYVLHVQGRGGVLRYRWRALWQGRLDTLHADAVAITMRPLPHTSNTALSIPLEPPSVLLARLPVTAITLPQISIDARLAAGEQHFSGSLDYRDGVLQLQLADSGKPQLSAHLRADRHDQLALTVQRGQTLLAQLNNRIESPRRLRGELKVQIEPLSAVLQDWGLLDRAAVCSGLLSATWLGPLPASLDASSWRSTTLTGEIEAQIKASDSSRRGEANLRADYAMAQGVVTAKLQQATGSGSLPVPAVLAKRLALPATQILNVAANTATLQITPQPLQLAWSGALSLTAAAPQQTLHAALTLADTMIDCSTDCRFDTNYQAQVTLERFTHSAYRAQRAHLQLAGSVAGTPAQGSLRIAPGAQLSMKSTRWPGGSTGPISVRTGEPIEIAFTSDRLQLPAAVFEVGPTSITHENNRYHLTKARLLLRDGALDFQAAAAASAQMKLHITRLSAPVGSYRIEPVDVQANLKAGQRVLQGNWSVHAANDLFSVRGTLHHSLLDGRGVATATLPPLAFHENGRYLPALFAAWPYPVDFSGGQLGFNARVQWRPENWSARLNLDLHDVAGFYQLNLFKGLNGHLRADYANGAVQMPATPIALAELDTGIALQQLSFTAEVAAPDEVRVRDLQAQLLGGRMYQRAFNYRWRANENTIPLLFEGIQLNQLLTLEQNIEGSGILDGRLPVTLNAQGIAVQNGSFEARAPGGVIRYNGNLPQKALASVPELQLALDSLKNFHYSQLSVSANYAPTGDLALRTVLHGRNPEFAGARPVHFNLNIQENIPDLLRSIQLGSDISDSIEKRIQDFYQHQSQESAP